MGPTLYPAGNKHALQHCVSIFRSLWTELKVSRSLLVNSWPSLGTLGWRRPFQSKLRKLLSFSVMSSWRHSVGTSLDWEVTSRPVYFINLELLYSLQTVTLAGMSRGNAPALHGYFSIREKFFFFQKHLICFSLLFITITRFLAIFILVCQSSNSNKYVLV